jgi:hypothetical protein
MKPPMPQLIADEEDTIDADERDETLSGNEEDQADDST